MQWEDIIGIAKLKKKGKKKKHNPSFFIVLLCSNRGRVQVSTQALSW